MLFNVILTHKQTALHDILAQCPTMCNSAHSHTALGVHFDENPNSQGSSSCDSVYPPVKSPHTPQSHACEAGADNRSWASGV